MAPGETRSRPIRERQSVCPIRRVRAGVWKGTQERKTGLAAGHWKTVLDGEVLRVGVGTRDAYLAIRSDDQLENRFEPMMLPVWEATDDCCSLLASFAASLPLRRPSPIATLDMARYLLTRSEGTIGELAHLLMAAAIAAVESGEEAINHRTLSMADYTGPSERRRQFERELM